MNLQYQHCKNNNTALSTQQTHTLLKQINGWEIAADNHSITKRFHFDNFYLTMAFVNAIAWIANQENHHPDLMLGYNYCTVTYSTHSAKGLTENDFICAAKIDALEVSS